MFKKFDQKEDITGSQQLKSSVQVHIILKKFIFRKVYEPN